MKICFIAPANNYHTKKWCAWFVNQGHTVHVISFVKGSIDNVTVHYLSSGAKVDSGDLKKTTYILKAKKMRKIIDGINPDIVHAHYASSYGTVAALSGLGDYYLSLWGSDVFAFPKKSLLHKAILKYSLSKATYIFSTSYYMRKEAQKYTNKQIIVTPFGVDMSLFSPEKRVNGYDNSRKRIIVGTVKSLEPVYGIDCLIKAVSLFCKEHPDKPIELRIAGDGSCREQYIQLAENLGLDSFEFLGSISQEDAAREWASFDIGVIFSKEESFGVSAIEAQATGTPLIISNVGGLLETTNNGANSYVVNDYCSESLMEAINYMYQHPTYREELGIRGRNFVLQEYEINTCFSRIEHLYKLYG